MSRGWFLMLCVVGYAVVGEALFAQTAAPSAQGIRKMTYTYKTVGNLEIQADVYRPADDRIRPVVVYIHGGALMTGSREAVGVWADKLVKSGWRSSYRSTIASLRRLSCRS